MACFARPASRWKQDTPAGKRWPSLQGNQALNKLLPLRHALLYTGNGARALHALHHCNKNTALCCGTSSRKAPFVPGRICMNGDVQDVRRVNQEVCLLNNDQVALPAAKRTLHRQIAVADMLGG